MRELRTLADAEDPYDTVTGKTMCTYDFYEGNIASKTSLASAFAQRPEVGLRYKNTPLVSVLSAFSPVIRSKIAQVSVSVNHKILIIFYSCVQINLSYSPLYSLGRKVDIATNKGRFIGCPLYILTLTWYARLTIAVSFCNQCDFFVCNIGSSEIPTFVCFSDASTTAD